MSRRKSPGTTASLVRQVQLHASSALAKLRKDIRAKEIELVTLNRHQKSLSRLTERGGYAGGGARVARAAGGGGKRINWRNVLAQLPKQFKASNVRQMPGLKDKHPSEIFSAISRWMEAGWPSAKHTGSTRKPSAPANRYYAWRRRCRR